MNAIVAKLTENDLAFLCFMAIIVAAFLGGMLIILLRDICVRPRQETSETEQKPES